MCLKLYTKLFNGLKKYPINFHVNINHICWITKFQKWPMNFAMKNAAEKVNVEVLVWISAKNNLTAVVKMHELSQYVVKSISRVWVKKFINKKLLENRFWYRYKVIYEYLQHFFIENQKKNAKKCIGYKNQFKSWPRKDISSKPLNNIYSSYSWVHLHKIRCYLSGS